MGKKRKGFTLLELIIAIGILLGLLAIGFPLYQTDLRKRAVSEATRIFELKYGERKERAVALGTSTGLCVDGSNIIYAYEFNPFSPSLFSMQQVLDLNKEFGTKVTIAVAPTGGSLMNPCNPGESAVQLSPHADSSQDWQGKIYFSSGSASWHMEIQNGAITDGP